MFMVMRCMTAAARDESKLSRLFVQYKVKEGIVKSAKGLLKHTYLVPSGPYFQLFDWDTYFMGVALSEDGAQPEALEGSVEDFLEMVGQNANDTGYVPREIAPDGFWALPEMCKPFLAQAAYRASRTAGSADWLKPWTKQLAQTLEFWENTRQSADGFFRWYNGVESGVYNNPAVVDRPAEVTEGVDLQCYLYREYRAMGLLAGKVGDAQKSKEYDRKADDLGARVRDGMWSETEGMFLNIYARTGKPIRIKTWTNFMPLWAGIATSSQAKRMIEEHLLNPKEFWAPHGIRTLSPDELLYDPIQGYWRGPVWVVSSYLMTHGLMNNGYREQARKLAEETEELLFQDGRPLAGSHFVSWDLLGEHIVEETQKGIDPTALNPF